MRPATTLVLLAAVALMSLPAQAQIINLFGQRTVWANGPGLECRETTHPTYGYAAPSENAARVNTFNLVVPVTGPAVKGFLPAVLQDRRQVWVRASDTMRNTRYRSCFVRRLPDGRLIYSSHDRIHGD